LIIGHGLLNVDFPLFFLSHGANHLSRKTSPGAVQLQVKMDTAAQVSAPDGALRPAI
jgi:hypothetical protein